MSRLRSRARAGSRVVGWMPKGFIRNMTYGTIALADTIGSNTAAIAIGNVANAYVQWLGTSSESTTTQSSYGRVSLTNATTVTAMRDVTSLAITIGFLVVEFFPGVLKSVQEATIAMTSGNTSGTATITTVSVPRTQVIFRGWGVDTGDTETQSMSRATLTDATTLTATRFNSTNNANCYATAVEFAAFG